MLTPQEVSEKKFAKAVFGGYDMSEVDDFLDALAADYDKLFKDTAVLKSKLKALAQKVEEYRAVDEELRKTLVAAKRQTDEQIANAAAEAAKTVEAARAESTEMLALARAEAEELAGRSRSESEHMLSSARFESERIMNEARSTSESLASKAQELSDKVISEARRDSDALLADTRHRCDNMLIEERVEAESYLRRLSSQIELEEARLSSVQGKLNTYVNRATEACRTHIETLKSAAYSYAAQAIEQNRAHIDELQSSVKASEEELGLGSRRMFEVPFSEHSAIEAQSHGFSESAMSIDLQQTGEVPVAEEVDLSAEIAEAPHVTYDAEEGEAVAAFAPESGQNSYNIGGTVVQFDEAGGDAQGKDGVFDDIFK